MRQEWDNRPVLAVTLLCAQCGGTYRREFRSGRTPRWVHHHDFSSPTDCPNHGKTFKVRSGGIGTSVEEITARNE